MNHSHPIQRKKKPVGRAFTAVLLCLSLLMPFLPGFLGLLTLPALAAGAGPTEKILEKTRVADPSTMDSYVNNLLSLASGSRYAGRVWTDKSVFAFDSARNPDRNNIGLDMATDGYDGGIGFSADFAHVFSALASSQVVNEYPPSPVDLVIVFDMSASMGQDIRYGLDDGFNIYTSHNKSVDGTVAWPDDGVPMAERIENSRIQQTLNAINKTIDKLMAHNPQNRVSVLCYGANATVIMPLAHYRKVDADRDGDLDPYLTVGGMETLYHPGDLVYRDEDADTEAGWYWINNRDTCYTVCVNAEKNEKTDALTGGQSWENLHWDPITFTVSNNVRSKGVKAFPGVADPKNPGDNSENEKKSQEIYNANYNGEEGKPEEYAAGQEKLIKAVENTKELDADDYVGYYTNTQGGIYLAYKQLADSKATTYTEALSNGKLSTVARIPAAIVMSDGGANFAFNRMGDTVDDWNLRFGAHYPDEKFNSDKINEWYWEDNAWGPKVDEKGNVLADQQSESGIDVGGREEDVAHRINENCGDEWKNVYLPGNDTLMRGTPGRTTADGTWDGLHTLYNTGADYYHDGTLSSPPTWNNAGVFYSNNNDPFGTSAATIQVLLTAAYMNTVVKKHYENGWVKDGAARESRIPLSTYTMNVDSDHVPQWGKMRLYPTLNPKKYAIPALGSETWYTDEALFGPSDLGYGGMTLKDVYSGIYTTWTNWLANGTEGANHGADQHKVHFDTLAKMAEKNAESPEFSTGYGDVAEVTDEELLANIGYNDDFYDVSAADVGEYFDQILSLILGNVFTPVSGDNDAGVGDSVTYQDPLGVYMEPKNGSIFATPFHTNETLPDEERTFDMALLLFGEMHGLVRTGVYDFHWNEEHKGNAKDITPGWYKGENRYEGEGLPDGLTSTEAAWAAGWVYRFDYATLSLVVPITAETEEGEVPQQARNTVYTIYRFACDEKDRNVLRRNPIYGSVPEELETEWEALKEKNGSYPVGNEIYAGTPGVYRLSDIRVWIEDTGDFVDSEGAIAPEKGYDRALYLNVPAAALPTQLAEITLGREGVLSYETNLGSDHENLKDGNEEEKAAYRNYCYQSTPLRLFYAVGLEEDLILRDGEGEQIGVNIAALSEEYVREHTNPEDNSIWFYSNYYSNTTYDDYVTDTVTSRTRGDPTVTFSPSGDNRYYIFQKALALYAHAYRATADGLKPVDNAEGVDFGADGSGNGKTRWETLEVDGAATQQYGGSWAGGRFMGVYEGEADFLAKEAEGEESGTLTDRYGNTYPYEEGGIVFFESDLLSDVTSGPDGNAAPGAHSFSSDDYYFLLVDVFLPHPGELGKNAEGENLPGTMGGEEVQLAVSRKGSEFGSGFHSENIGNGDMLCWSDVSGRLNFEFSYLSRTETKDNTRGKPTYEKFTKKGDELRRYLKEKCGLSETVPEGAESSPLDDAVAYWEKIQAAPVVDELFKEADEEVGNRDGSLTKEEFEKAFHFAVSARPGGIRSGDMANNRRPKSENTTETAVSYYVPTVSENSATDEGVILDIYLGNNGRLAVANSTLLVTKLLEAPEGFIFTAEQEKEPFFYQVYAENLTGVWEAAMVHYNPFSGTWQRQLAYVDVLTDNGGLLLDNSMNRALFVHEDGAAKQIVANGTDEDGNTRYFYAEEDGTPGQTECTNTEHYYLYLPANGTVEFGEHTRRLWQDPDYEGDDKNAFDLSQNRLTIYYGAGQSHPENGDGIGYSEANGSRPTGTFAYWAEDAELIPVSEVAAAENTDGILNGEPGEIATVAMESANGGSWSHEDGHNDSHIHLGYYTVVVSRPNGESSENTVVSPFKTTTRYLTKSLNFGFNANADGDGEPGEPLTGEQVYDPILPTVDRPTLFSEAKRNDTAEKVAAHTAEFTLRHGEGLLLTGLGNRIVYRFTEMLTEEQIERGYTLKKISHVQQRGSDTVYLPGVQKVPVYTDAEGNVTWALKQGSATERIDLTPQWEAFAHTNATLWESYATMADGSLGNHHQPLATTEGDNQAAKNPSCKNAETEEALNVGSCDLAQDDGSTRHYFYYGGKLVDPHYEGEMEGMSRYVLNPTAHFGVKGETVSSAPAIPPEEGYDYNGVYSVYGDTGYFEEQAHFINTVDPDLLVLTKDLVDLEGKDVPTPPEKKFEFKLTLTPSGKEAMTDADGKFYYWKGLKANLGKTVEAGGPPTLEEYTAHLEELNLAEPVEGVYRFELKADEAVVIYGLPAEMGYTVEETPAENYPAVDGETHTEIRDDYYKQTGTVKHHADDRATVTNPEKTENRADFYNQKATGSLTVQKKIADEGADKVEKEFGFTVELTPDASALKKEELTATKYRADGTPDTDFTYEFTEIDEDGDGAPEPEKGLRITFKLKHGEQVVLEGLPFGTKFKVTETDREGYNLQHVADNLEDKPTDGHYLPITDGSVEGTVTRETPQTYTLFSNAKPAELPFTGSYGLTTFYALGALILLAGTAVAVKKFA